MLSHRRLEHFSDEKGFSFLTGTAEMCSVAHCFSFSRGFSIGGFPIFVSVVAVTDE